MHIIKEQHLWLTTSRCIYWEEKKTLILSDLHFGKTGHFRKAGIAVPPQIYQEDLQRLWSVIQDFHPQNIIFVGDLFHSHENLEHQLFKKWRNDHADIEMQLVLGNHDILGIEIYQQMGLSCHADTLDMEPFTFIHDGVPDDINSRYYFTGHLHPGVRIEGYGKQSLKFPCFYFAERFAVLPAFSRFTGLALVQPQKNEKIFAIADTAIIEL